MESLIHRSPSVGSLIKKIVAINPELNTLEIIQMVKQSIRKQSAVGDELASEEVIDEGHALDLARRTVRRTAPTLGSLGVQNA